MVLGDVEPSNNACSTVQPPPNNPNLLDSTISEHFKHVNTMARGSHERCGTLQAACKLGCAYYSQ
jgi:hypothetical protein